MWLYYFLKTLSAVISHLPYRLVVRLGIVLGRLYAVIAKKQRLRAEKNLRERLGLSGEDAEQNCNTDTDFF